MFIYGSAINAIIKVTYYHIAMKPGSLYDGLKQTSWLFIDLDEEDENGMHGVEEASK